MSSLVQDLIVAAIALGAAAFVLRRVVDAIRPEPTEAGCEHCGLQPAAPVQAPPVRTPPSS